MRSDTRDWLRCGLLPLGLGLAASAENTWANGWIGAGLGSLALAQLGETLRASLLIALVALTVGWLGGWSASRALPRVSWAGSVTTRLLTLGVGAVLSWNQALPWRGWHQVQAVGLGELPLVILAVALLMIAGVALLLQRTWREPHPVHWPRWTLLMMAMAALVGVGVDLTREQPAPDAPDVLLVTIDTLRADRVGFGGASPSYTPHMDALAAKGIVFDRAVAPASWTLPSLASLLTGRHPHEHRATSFGSRLPRAQTTLAEVARDAGYATGAVTSHVLSSRRYGLAQGFQMFSDRHVESHLEISSPRLTDVAVRWLAGAGDRPVFLWVHYFDPHSSYVDHDDQSIAQTGVFRSAYRESTLRHTDVSDEELAHVLDLYDEEIATTDAQIGRLLEAWHARESSRPDVVVVTADHGELFGEGGRYGHGFADQEVLAVPLVLSGTSIAWSPEPVSRVVETRAVAGTLARIAGFPRSSMSDSTSLLDDVGAPRPILVEASSSTGDRDARCVYFGNYKYIFDELSSREELYDLRLDPEERNDLLEAGDPSTAQLAARLHSFLRSTGPRAPGESAGKLSGAEEESLRSLGYLN